MSTRGAMGVRIDGKDVITYNHFDSYPEGLGEDIVKDIRETPLLTLKRAAKMLKPVDEDKEPTEEQIKELATYLDLSVSEQSEKDWYCLLRKTQGSLTMLLAAGYYADASDFLTDSLFCEYAYIVNFDDNLFEVYQGFQKNPHKQGRYALKKLKDYGKVNQYYPIALVATFPLDAIPENWIEQAFPKEEDN